MHFHSRCACVCDGGYHWEDGDLATCSWKVLTTCTCQIDYRKESLDESRRETSARMQSKSFIHETSARVREEK